LDEIVVKATKMETSIKEIPASVSAIMQKDIKGGQAIRVEEKRDFPRIPI
jgi:outer membrane cobalamin receptor